MRIGEIVNGERGQWGRPLEGLRVLAAEQMQALPYATQLLAHLGADVVKIEPPGRGDTGRYSQPSLEDADGNVIYQHQTERHEEEEVDPLTLERYSKIQQLSRAQLSSGFHQSLLVG